METTLLGVPADWPCHPYPGARPAGNWRLRNSMVHRFGFDVPHDDRLFLLAYGSNANPMKLVQRLDDVIVFEATITDAQAVWSNSRRFSGEVVSTVVIAPGHSESCPVLAVTPDQLAHIDRWEGAPVRYRRESFWGKCTLTGGTVVSPQVYVGTDEVRPPLLVDGSPLRLSEHCYEYVDRLVNQPG